MPRHVIVTNGVYSKRVILMEDSVADIAVADGWASEWADFVPPEDGADITLPERPQSLIDFEDAIDRGKISIDTPVDYTPPGGGGSVPILAYISPTSSKLNPLVELDLLCYCDSSLSYHADMWVMIDGKRYEYDGSWNQQYLKVILPKADLSASGVRQVRVCDAAGESLPQPFTVEEAPPFALSSYSPNPIPAGLATGVTVMGSSFDATTEFYLDGGPFDPSWVVVNTSTRATLTAPSAWVAGDHVLTAFSNTLGQNSNELPVTVAAALGRGQRS